MNAFDEAMLDRLRASSTEAARVVLDLVKSGRNMPDAIADAVETLPWPETSALRRWTENWEGLIEWRRFEATGWKIDKATTRRVLIEVPKGRPQRDLARVLMNMHRTSTTGSGYEMKRLVREGHAPSEAAVAAAADVGVVDYPLIVDSKDVHWPYGIAYLVYDVKRQK